MLLLRQLARCSRGVNRRFARSYTTAKVQTDELGIPLKSTWSVNTLLSSYPSPKIAPETLKKLYQLSALVPPEEGSPEHAKVTRDLEEMVRLVEAVKLVDTKGTTVEAGIEREDMDRKLFGNPDEQRAKEVHGQELLKLASRTVNGYYVVEADRTRGGEA
ncbi:hypothetical protein BKA70DRAFT_568268 [Coprinopsis sp. MPI-PUGE-AT-0042]|nr:hypothetical protein BKA70DRAFT_568268 [Coprinopsis sp. MPI-PUGE-AT-0042]